MVKFHQDSQDGQHPTANVSSWIRNMMRNRLELFRIKIELSLKEEEMFGFWQKGEITVELYILWETYCIKMTWSKVDYMEPRNLEGE